jgi:hypothetical protein
LKSILRDTDGLLCLDANINITLRIRLCDDGLCACTSYCVICLLAVKYCARYGAMQLAVCREQALINLLRRFSLFSL